MRLSAFSAIAETQVDKVVLLLAPEGLARLHAEARALADDLDALVYLKMAVERLTLDAHALPIKIEEDVCERCSRAEAIDRAVVHLVEDRDALRLHAPADIPPEDLPDNETRVGALVDHLGTVERLVEAALEDVAVELDHRAGADRPRKRFISRYSLKLSI